MIFICWFPTDRITDSELNEMAELFGFAPEMRGIRGGILDPNIGGMRIPRVLQRGLNGALGFRYQRAIGDTHTEAVPVYIMRLYRH